MMVGSTRISNEPYSSRNGPSLVKLSSQGLHSLETLQGSQDQLNHKTALTPNITR